MDKKLIQITNKLIEKECLSLNSEISSKLNQARQKALLTNKKRSSFLFSWYIPTTVMATLVVYFMLLHMQTNIEPEEVMDNNFAVIVEMEILNQYELIENLEFYQWLSQEDATSI
ncbi:MAG: hypothetical protein JKY19_03225 [Alcanivoracaceae bacterium]|nr:hypothetical protein [Alcanivoracaceae bacterium]